MRQAKESIPTKNTMLRDVPDLASRGIEYMAESRTQTLESVAAYSFLLREFKQPPITQNHLFQFVYRSFYRMDFAGLLPAFHEEYFKRMEELREVQEINVGAVVRDLSAPSLNRKNKLSYQFSFVTKLAHTVNPSRYPIFDSEVAEAFGYSPPYRSNPDARLNDRLGFYEQLQSLYAEILANKMMNNEIRTFCDKYVRADTQLPPLKCVDFIFWSAGKSKRKGEKED